jgi:hypothetical protein
VEKAIKKIADKQATDDDDFDDDNDHITGDLLKLLGED